MEAYTTLAEAIDAMKVQGYTEDFNLHPGHISCQDETHCITPDDFVIDKSFRFDENEDPADQSVLYAISSSRYNLKGILVNGYGIYSDNVTNAMLEKLHAKKPEV